MPINFLIKGSILFDHYIKTIGKAMHVLSRFSKLFLKQNDRVYVLSRPARGYIHMNPARAGLAHQPKE